MRISHKYKYIFFSNPKTGSESVREMLNRYSDIRDVAYLETTEENPFYSHITPNEVKNIFKDKGWDFDEYYKFTFVRNPWERLVSLYEMLAANCLYKAEFKKWVRTIKPYGCGGGGLPHERWRRYGAYSIFHYITDENNNILVDKVIRLEDIDKELIPTLKNIGLPYVENMKILKINSRKHKPYYEYYDEDTVRYVRNLFEYDIVNFGYKFKVEGII